MKLREKIAITIALSWLVFQLYVAGINILPPIALRPVHMMFACLMAFTLWSSKGREGEKRGLMDKSTSIVAVVFAVAAAIYLLMNAHAIMSRYRFMEPVTIPQYILGLAFLAVILEAGRRVIGNVLTGLGVFFLIYAYFGPYFPGILRHSGLSIKYITELQFLTTSGIFGMPVWVSVAFVFYFVVLANFVLKSGGGDFLKKFASGIFGKFRGGSAKAAIAGSSLLGMISGSAAANTAATGSFTIPMMKNSGVKSDFSAGVEASASTGGQIMPPIMGAAAFLLAFMIGRPYAKVMIEAFIPAIIFYISLFVLVHFRSLVEGHTAVPEDMRPDVWGLIKEYGHLFIPIVLLVYWIVQGTSLMRASFRALMILFPIVMVRSATRLNLEEFLDATKSGCRTATIVALPCSIAGIIISVVQHTGLGLKLTHLFVSASGGMGPILLILAMGITLILGMGMPTTGAYLTASILVAPSIISLTGVTPTQAHFFVFYFGVMSMVTPPIAICSYVAAGIADADMWKASIEGVKLCLPGFIIPFWFIYQPGLLLKGTIIEIVTSIVFLSLGILLLDMGIGLSRFFKNIGVRVLFLGLGTILLVPTTPTLIRMIVGGVGAVSAVVFYIFRLSGYERESKESKETKAKESKESAEFEGPG